MTKILIDIQLVKQALDVINSECGFGGTHTYEPRAVAEALYQFLDTPQIVSASASAPSQE